MSAGRVGHPLGHDEGHVRRRLAERLDHEAAGLAQEDAERVGRGRIHVLHEREQLLAHRVALAPARQRGDHVLTRHRLAVVEFEALAQLEGPQALVRALGPALDHLRLDLAVGVGAEQGVVDHVAVVADHVLRGPDGVEDGQVGVRHHLQHLLLRERGRGRHQRTDGDDARCDQRPACQNDRDLADPRLPFPRPGLVHRRALRIDGDRDRHVDDLELVDRFHAQVGEADHLRALDRLRHQIGGAADRHQVGGLVLLDRLNGDRAALGLADHRDQTGLSRASCR